MELEVRVVPNAKKFSVSVKEGIVRIRVPAKAEDGKANRELEVGLGKALNAKVRLVRGARSRIKTLEIGADAGDVMGRLQNFSKTTR